MHIDWPWRPVPEVRDLPRAEQKRIWRRCSGRAMLSWQFIVSMALGLLAVGAIWFAAVLALSALRVTGLDAPWVWVVACMIVAPMMAVGTTLTMQPWVNETRKRIREERGQSHVS